MTTQPDATPTVQGRKRRNHPASMTWAPGVDGLRRCWCAAALALALLGLSGKPPGAMAVEMRAGEVRLVALGDSLVAGFGLAPQDGFVAQLQKWLTSRDGAITIVNGGVSGDTTTGGRARLDWAVGSDADGVILALGANDMLRGIDPALARANLAAMLERLQARGLPVLLAGMRAGANLGPQYRDQFDRIYPELAAEYDALLYPFLLAGMALEPALNQADGIHPNADGVRVMVAGIGPQVLELANRIRAH